MIRQAKYLLLLPFFLSFIFPQKAAAVTETITVSQDTYANEAYPDKINGDQASIILSNKYTNRLIFLFFDLTDLPETTVVDKAVLRFYIDEANYDNKAKLNIGPVTADWSENELNWNNKPTIEQNQADETELDLTSGWKEINLTTLTQKWLNQEVENHGLFIYPFGFLYADAETEFSFSAKSKESKSSAAQLVISYNSTTPTASVDTDQPLTATDPALSAAGNDTPIPITTTDSEKASLEPEEADDFITPKSSNQLLILGVVVILLLAAGITFLVSTLHNIRPKNSNEESSQPEAEDEEEL